MSIGSCAVLPLHLPGHWMVAIYDTTRRIFCMKDSLFPGKPDDDQDKAARQLLRKYLRAAFSNTISHMKGLHVGGTPQSDSVSCEWHVAEFVRMFFRENRGEEDWTETDWAGSLLIQSAPTRFPKQEAIVLSWMFAIRSELNGTRDHVRKGTPASVTLDEMQAIKNRHGLLPQMEVIKQNLCNLKVNEALNGRLNTVRTMTLNVEAGMADRFNLPDIQPSIDHRISRNTLSLSEVNS